MYPESCSHLPTSHVYLFTYLITHDKCVIIIIIIIIVLINSVLFELRLIN